ncbi:CsbD family protein [Roseimaritima sediminicola]|uniref:DUF883 family protein n=1 Tax=Roseimaritima sediminicola TaxID=2662066 RepID=UPI00129827F9|nr:DUF883 family protein [Roseimaritima sediminicola]
MSTKQELQARWNDLKQRLQQHWQELTDGDFQHAAGSPEQLVETIHKKTGAARREIEVLLSTIVDEQERMMHRATSSTQDYAEAAQQAAQQYADEAAALARDGYQRAAAMGNDLSRKLVRTVRERPTESLAVAFGVGVLAGACLLLNRRGR